MRLTVLSPVHSLPHTDPLRFTDVSPVHTSLLVQCSSQAVNETASVALSIVCKTHGARGCLSGSITTAGKPAFFYSPARLSSLLLRYSFSRRPVRSSTVAPRTRPEMGRARFMPSSVCSCEVTSPDTQESNSIYLSNNDLILQNPALYSHFTTL